MVIDHVVMLVPDAGQAAQSLRDRHGLGSERGPYHPFAGTRNHGVPLEPPSYLEFLTIENREVAETTEAGRRVLACEAAGFDRSEPHRANVPHVTLGYISKLGLKLKLPANLVFPVPWADKSCYVGAF